MVSLRDDVNKEEFRFSVEDKVRLGREAVRLGLWAIGANLILMATFVAALFATLTAGRRLFALPAVAWWVIYVVVLSGLGPYLWRSSRCPGCGRLLGGRFAYEWVCVQCGIPLNYFAWRRFRDKAQTRQ